jgi:hypothetical protein
MNMNHRIGYIFRFSWRKYFYSSSWMIVSAHFWLWQHGSITNVSFMIVKQHFQIQLFRSFSDLLLFIHTSILLRMSMSHSEDKNKSTVKNLCTPIKLIFPCPVNFFWQILFIHHTTTFCTLFVKIKGAVTWIDYLENGQTIWNLHRPIYWSFTKWTNAPILITWIDFMSCQTLHVSKQWPLGRTKDWKSGILKNGWGLTWRVVQVTQLQNVEQGRAAIHLCMQYTRCSPLKDLCS